MPEESANVCVANGCCVLMLPAAGHSQWSDAGGEGEAQQVTCELWQQCRGSHGGGRVRTHVLTDLSLFQCPRCRAGARIRSASSPCSSSSGSEQFSFSVALFCHFPYLFISYRYTHCKCKCYSNFVSFLFDCRHFPRQ